MLMIASVGFTGPDSPEKKDSCQPTSGQIPWYQWFSSDSIFSQVTSCLSLLQSLVRCFSGKVILAWKTKTKYTQKVLLTRRHLWELCVTNVCFLVDPWELGPLRTNTNEAVRQPLHCPHPGLEEIHMWLSSHLYKRKYWALDPSAGPSRHWRLQLLWLYNREGSCSLVYFVKTVYDKPNSNPSGHALLSKPALPLETQDICCSVWPPLATCSSLNI